jgi:hypothetical protein
VTTSSLSQKERIERVGNEWAPRFAADTTGSRCYHMTQPLCERIACVHVGRVEIKNCTPPTPAFQKSFAGARVDQVGVKGNRAAARFSNGEVVEFWGDGGTWSVNRIGPSADRGLVD